MAGLIGPIRINSRIVYVPAGLAVTILRNGHPFGHIR